MSKIIFLILIIICRNSYAQLNLDSLKGEWTDSTQLDTVRLEALVLFVRGYYKNPQLERDSAFYYIELLFDLAKEKGYEKYMSEALYQQAMYQMRKGDYDQALVSFEQDLKLCSETRNKEGEILALKGIGLLFDQKGDLILSLEYYNKGLKKAEEGSYKEPLASILYNMGNVYYVQGNYPAALNCFFKSLNIYDELGDNNTTEILNSLANIYSKQENVEQALIYYNRVLEIVEKEEDQYFIVAIMNNIGGTYEEQGEYTKALDFYSRGLEISTKYEYFDLTSILLSNTGIAYHLKGDYKTALDYAAKSLKIAKKYNELLLPDIYNQIGDVYYEISDYNNAIWYNTKSLQGFMEIGALIEVNETAESLLKTYLKAGKPDEAFEMYELYISTKDSIDSKSTQRVLLNQEYKYKYEKKVAVDSLAFVKQQEISDLTIAEQNAEIKSTQYFVLLLVSVLILGIILVTILYRGYKRKIEDHQLIAKQKQSLEQVNDELVSKKDKIEKQAKRILEANQKISAINESLEQKVKERTAKVQSQNETLRSHAFSISHVLRAPLARLMGLLYIIELSKDNVKEGEQNIMLDKLSSSAHELDEIVKNISELLNKEERVV